MTDVENLLLADETPEADAVEQRLTVDVDDETGLDSAHLDTINERPCNQTDLIDQAIIVGISEPPWQSDITPARNTTWWRPWTASGVTSMTSPSAATAYVDVEPSAQIPREEISAEVAAFAKNRAVIEQAKGMLMNVYGIGADAAFELLKWRSQETNVKLRLVAEQITPRLCRPHPRPPDTGADRIRQSTVHGP
jgi:ANTAR domain